MIERWYTPPPFFIKNHFSLLNKFKIYQHNSNYTKIKKDCSGEAGKRRIISEG